MLNIDQLGRRFLVDNVNVGYGKKSQELLLIAAFGIDIAGSHDGVAHDGSKPAVIIPDTIAVLIVIRNIFKIYRINGP